MSVFPSQLQVAAGGGHYCAHEAVIAGNPDVQQQQSRLNSATANVKKEI